MYIATFHSHFDAMLTAQKLERNGIKVSLRPVPRKISSSCGTCAAFETNDFSALSGLFSPETDAVYDDRTDPPSVVYKKDEHA